MNMNSVGIDVSKGKSTIAVMRPFGEVVVSPFEVNHTGSELNELAKLLKSLDGETRVVMEATGNYHAPVAWLLHDAGLYVSVVNAMLVHGYGNNSLRRAKTDKKDAVKLANYGIEHWLSLPKYVPEEDTRLMLKNCHRQYQQYAKVQTMLKNNLISLLDMVFPEADRLFSSPPRADGSEKWVDFVADFWHCECVSSLSQKAFTTKYQKWCKKAWLLFQPRQSSGHLYRCLRSHWRNAKDRYHQTSGGTGRLAIKGDRCRLSGSPTGNAVVGCLVAGISGGDANVWRWNHSWSSAYGRNWGCAPLSLQESPGGLCGS
jgi:hypothetical protein